MIGTGVLLNLVCWWVSPELPVEHVWIKPEDRPKEWRKVVRVYFRKWIVHPVKRRVAKYYLVFLRWVFGLKVVGVTGSAGKTTTKEMIVAILGQKGEVVWSFANIDPVYNIPATILRCRPRTRFLVLEMGVEYPGEMDFYLWLANPDVGVITNLNLTHTEFLGGLFGVVREKTKLVRGLGRKGVAVLNGNDKVTRQRVRRLAARKLWYGEGGGVEAKEVELDKEGNTDFNLVRGEEKVKVKLRLLGEQFVEDALAAVTVGEVLGIEFGAIEKGLESVKPESHRMVAMKTAKYGLIVDDTYNSNPLAAKRALEMVAKLVGKGRKVAVLGDMKELGGEERRAHLRVGMEVAGLKYDWLLTLGKAASYMGKGAVREGMEQERVRNFEGKGELIGELRRVLGKNTVCLVKGSRSMEMEEIVAALTN